MAGESKAKKQRQGPAVPEGLELHKDGTVTFHVAGDRIRLRRPKIGELRKLRELLLERDAKIEEARATLLAQQVAAAERGDDEPAPEPEIDVVEFQSQANSEWFIAALDMLGDSEPPPVDEWPSGMDQAGVLTGLMTHWREVPLRSGA